MSSFERIDVEGGSQALAGLARAADDDAAADAAAADFGADARRAATPGWLRAFEQQKRDRAHRRSYEAPGNDAPGHAPSPAREAKRRPRRQTFGGAIG